MAIARTDHYLPSVALIIFRAEWFDNVVALPELTEAVQTDTLEILSHLGEVVEVENHWVINSAQSLELCKSGLSNVSPDLLILMFQVWAEDYYINALRDFLTKTSLLVWCYQPWLRPKIPMSFVEVLRASGPVGTFEGLGTLRNLRIPFSYTFGSQQDLHVIRDIQRAARVGRVVRSLRKARFGLLPARNEQMQSTFVDEFRLMAEIGPTVRMFSVAELAKRTYSIPDEEVKNYLLELQEHYQVIGVPEETLALAVRCSLGLAHLAVDHQIDLLSFNDISDELHETLGLRPCLYLPLIDESGIQIALEGDLGSATAMFVLKILSGSPIFFVEIWFWDEIENVIIGGHAGMQNPACGKPGEIWISQDYEFAQSDRYPGAHWQYVAKPGEVTLFQLRGTPEGWQAIVATGQAIDTKPWIEGYPHAVIRLDVSIDHFNRRVAKVGSTQHWVMAYGNFVLDLQALCEILNISLEIIVD